MSAPVDAPASVSYIRELTALREWEPGDPLYRVSCVSYTLPPITYEPCPPRCWCRSMERGDRAMRWTPDMAPVLRFRPYDGLHVTGNVPRPRLAELMPWERRRVRPR